MKNQNPTKLQELRLKAGLTQAELAHKLGYSTAQYISNVELRRCQFSPKKFKQAAKILGADPMEFADEKLALLEAKLRKAFRISK